MAGVDLLSAILKHAVDADHAVNTSPLRPGKRSGNVALSLPYSRGSRYRENEAMCRY